MYDDIASHPDNPRPGVVINHPQGSDVYEGVPKDYTGNDVTVSNFFAVLLGDKSRVQGGSGKVINSGPEDHIFVFYSDHGGPGVLGMPSSPNLYANDFVEVLRQKHAAGTFKEMVIYLEACESGSILEGLLPDGLNIYATTASNAEENSWGTYCPGMFPPPPPEFGTCLGDLYSVSWMEDSEIHNLKRETLRDQYFTVRERTSNHNTYRAGSHVMQYGDVQIGTEHVSKYLGFDSSNENVSWPYLGNGHTGFSSGQQGINQRDADLVYFWQKYNKAKDGSEQKMHALNEIIDILRRRMYLDKSVELLSKLLFGSDAGLAIAKAVRPAGKPLVDDWNCLKDMVSKFEASCGPLAQYGMKHMRTFANFCNAGITADTMASASSELCAGASVQGYEFPLLRSF
ncbi:hypothetical protein O6H91_01G130800 [Diphasiastrum complanatum]|nr:hypothetical protein O6H91_01G130800 [Diphasiastrum complanatum]